MTTLLKTRSSFALATAALALALAASLGGTASAIAGTNHPSLCETPCKYPNAAPGTAA